MNARSNWHAPLGCAFWRFEIALLRVAIDRFTGKLIDKQIEVVNEQLVQRAASG